jgi:hypothetical protein
VEVESSYRPLILCVDEAGVTTRKYDGDVFKVERSRGSIRGLF